jgi:hypothetical protein
LSESRAPLQRSEIASNGLGIPTLSVTAELDGVADEYADFDITNTQIRQLHEMDIDRFSRE